jgi:hypothetical protein
MNRSLDMQSAERLAKLCGMLGSAHDGERAAAGLKADQFVRGLGLTWGEIFSAPRTLEPPRTDWQRMAYYCHRYRAALKERDRAFIATMLAWRGTPTDRQQEWLIDLYSRLHREANR